MHNIRLSLGTLWLPPELIFPLGDMLKLIEQEYTFTLTLTDGLHDPNLAGSLKFFDEKTIIAGQIVGGWVEIVLVGLRHLALTLKLFFVPFKVFYHQIFSS